VKRVITSKAIETKGEIHLISESEAHHLFQVFRADVGDSIEVLDGQGGIALGKIIDKKKGSKGGSVEIVSIPQKIPIEDQVLNLTLELAVLKNDSMSWVVEKAVELGAQKLVPIFCERTVVRLKARESVEFQERWQRTADQALKQCGRAWRIEVLEPIHFESWTLQSNKTNGLRLFCDEAQTQSSQILNVLELEKDEAKKGLHVLIGPEGGWSETERLLIKDLKGCKTISTSLGNLILRAETAAVSALSIGGGFLRKNRDLQ
jgi:16S rRNA (uracil1498-N3)-methyltransferase